MLTKKELTEIIALAIKDEDTRYFWENYQKQAAAVLSSLEDEGYIIVPKKANKEMVEAGVEALKYGRQHKTLVIQNLYYAMIAGAYGVGQKSKD